MIIIIVVCGYTLSILHKDQQQTIKYQTLFRLLVMKTPIANLFMQTDKICIRVVHTTVRAVMRSLFFRDGIKFVMPLLEFILSK